MQTGDFEQFRRGLGGVYDFYGKNVSVFALDVWWKALQAFDLDAVTEAFNRHLANPDTGQFLPKPADIVRMLSGTTQDAALVAWSRLDRAVREVGAWRSVVFDDPVIHRVVEDMGGWVPLGEKGEDEWPFVRNEFVNRYRGYRMAGKTPEYPPKLNGIAEAHNSREGFHVEPPVLIGDVAAAKVVIDGGSIEPLLRITQMHAPMLISATKTLQTVT